jgi:hypothetical protein
MEAIRKSFALAAREDHPHQDPNEATEVTVNRRTISEMISYGTGQQEHDHELPSRPRPARDSGPALLRPASSAYLMLILLPA